MRRDFLQLLATCALLFAGPVAAADFDPAPWVQDLEQARQAFHQKYANWDWVEAEHEVKIDALFDDSEQRIRKATSDRAAQAVFERIQRKLGDGHVEIEWPDPPQPSVPSAAAPPAPDPCKDIGYDPRQNGRGTAHALAGYTPLPAGSPFAAGTAVIAGKKIGFLRIGIFQPQGYPELCRTAVRELSIPVDKPCDDRCQNEIVTHAYRELTAGLEKRVGELKAAGATVLLVDITNNGGGSEWAEAAARIFTPKLLLSERRGFVRGEHWAKQWRELGTRLRDFGKHASRTDRAILLDYAAQADAALRDATSCPATSIQCERLGRAGYSTGLIGAARSGSFSGKEDWAVHLFSPSQFPYHDGVWTGPLIVLVDQETWSAAEEFAAVLQDNRAAVVMGARTGGAGCGYTWGGTPTKLKNSGAVLKLPDCVRFRADGSNEVRGILPDEVVALRFDDGPRFRARLVAEKLPEAIARAEALQAR